MPSSPKSPTATGTRTYVPKLLKVAVYADDRVDPKLVGETTIDLDPIIQRGQNDEWHSLEAKGKPAGEVFIEMTWYSNAPPPDKKPSSHHKKMPSASSLSTYGGRGMRASAAVDDHNLLYGDDNRKSPLDEWDTDIQRPRSTIGVQSTVEIPSDYPDPDLAPLTQSTTSRPPLPVAPIPGPSYSAAPPAMRPTTPQLYGFTNPLPAPPPPRISSQQYVYPSVPQQQQQPAWPPYQTQQPQYHQVVPEIAIGPPPSSLPSIPPAMPHHADSAAVPWQQYPSMVPPRSSSVGSPPGFVPPQPPPPPPSFEQWRAQQQQQQQQQQHPPYSSQAQQYAQVAAPVRQGLPRPPLPQAPVMSNNNNMYPYPPPAHNNNQQYYQHQ